MVETMVFNAKKKKQGKNLQNEGFYGFFQVKNFRRNQRLWKSMKHSKMVVVVVNPQGIFLKIIHLDVFFLRWFVLSIESHGMNSSPSKLPPFRRNIQKGRFLKKLHLSLSKSKRTEDVFQFPVCRSQMVSNKQQIQGWNSARSAWVIDELRQWNLTVY